jgi:hypothetical protein
MRVRLSAQKLIQIALVRLAGHDGGTAVAAAQHRLQRTQIQSALGLRRIVALQAFVFEQRFDVGLPQRVGRWSTKRQTHEPSKCQECRDGERSRVPSGYVSNSINHRRLRVWWHTDGRNPIIIQ